MDELLQRAAEKMGMPPVLAERSAQARAEKEGITVEAVLKEWAGEDTGSAGDIPAVDEQAPADETATSPATPAAEPAQTESGPTEVTTDYLVALAAESKRMPPKLVLSSAEARARNSKTDVDEVLADWAGIDLDELKEQAASGTAPVAHPPVDEPKAEPAPAPPIAEPDAEAGVPTPAAAAAAVASMSMDELLDKVAEAKGMPAPLAKRSAEARAKKTGEPLEAVLAEWAGVDVASVSDDQSAPASPEPEAASQAVAAPVAEAATGTMSMDELLDKVAEAKGMPAPLAKRSAEARAKKTGEPLEAVLAEWAGVDVASVAVAGAAQPVPPADSPATPAQPSEAGVEAVAEVEVIEAKESAPEGADEPKPVASGSGGYPMWLAAAFVIIPILAVVYILVSPNGPDCGVAGQLRVDEATGLAVNCDGSDFGSSSIDFLAIGSGIYSQCAACHGADGGGGVGPAFNGGAVLATFPSGSCSNHVEWVALGSANFPEATYGATNKPVGGIGVMPGYEGSLTPEEIAAVSLYERVQFGGQPIEEAEVDCGLVVPEGEEGADETTEAAGE